MDKFISRIFGVIANFEFPKFLQIFINKKYVSHFNINMSEFADISEFKSLNALFTRRLLKERKFDTSAESFISPSDGVIFENGVSSDLKAICVKGHFYDLGELLDESLKESEKNANLAYANIYLSPKDYHHYHAPCDIFIEEALYIPAKLYSVAKKYLIKIPNLYALNERVILRCKMPNGGKLWLVFVGALNVGKMKFEFDEKIQTNAKNLQKTLYKYENLQIKKGERLGNFELGSTVVVVSESEFLEFRLDSNESVKFSQTIAKLKLN